MTQLPRILAFDYVRHTYVAPLRRLVEAALAAASLVLIVAIVIGVIG